MKNKTGKDTVEKFFITIIGIVVIGLTLRELSNIFIPFVIAYFLFFLFSPLNGYLQNRRVPMFIIIILDIALAAVMITTMSRFVINSFMSFGVEAPRYAARLNEIVSGAAVSLGVHDPYYTSFSIENAIANIDYEWLAGGIFTSTFSLLGDILFVIFFFVFIVTGHNTMYEAIRKRYVNHKVRPELRKVKKELRKTIEVLPEQGGSTVLNEKLLQEQNIRENKLSLTFKTITEQIQKYIIAKIAINLLAGIVVTAMLYFLGIDFPILFGTLVFLLNFIPTIGSAVALFIPALMSLVQSGSFSFALLIVILMAIIQTLAFNILEPAVLGRRLNLNPLLILFSVLIWGYIWGIVGMLLSVPLTAIIKIIVSNSESDNMRFISDLMSGG